MNAQIASRILNELKTFEMNLSKLAHFKKISAVRVIKSECPVIHLKGTTR